MTLRYGHAVDCLDDLATQAFSPFNLYELLDEHGFSDGLPVGPLDVAISEQFIKALGAAPDDPVASIPPLRGALTARRLAAVAALAGCAPHHMPLLAALADALAAPELNGLGVLSTTSSAAFMVIVNGPARSSMGFNGGANCLGPGNRSNATVGRCLSLVTRMVGGAREGYADMATQGQPAKYSFCFAENEEASPWPALHAELGTPGERSSVTVVGVAGIVEAFEADSYAPEDMVAALGPVLAHASPAWAPRHGLSGGGHHTVVVSPEWADAFSGAGMAKPDVKRALLASARQIDPAITLVANSDDLLIVVAGGPGVKQNVVPGWAGGSAPVTRSFHC